MMAAPNLSPEELHALCGDMLDWKVKAILALDPTAADVSAAVAWLNGQDELLEEGHPLAGMAAQVYELLIADEDFGEDR